MNRQLIYKVPPSYAGRKVFDFLMEDCQLSRRFCKSATKEKRLFVNEKKAELGLLLHEEDTVKVIMRQQESQNILPEKMDLDIVYEDNDLIVVNKPAFLLVHPTKNHENGTLANGLMFHFQQNKSGDIVRFISRLDRDTSGLVLIAKNSFAHMRLAKEMEEHGLQKLYIAIISGQIEPSSGRIHKPIGKKFETDLFQSIIENGQDSETLYRTLKVHEGFSLLELELITGRTHQIRVHLQSVGHPLVGDSLYGGQLLPELIDRQALHAFKLTFRHPRTEEIICLEAPVPGDMKRVIGDMTPTS